MLAFRFGANQAKPAHVGVRDDRFSEALAPAGAASTTASGVAVASIVTLAGTAAGNMSSRSSTQVRHRQ